MPAVPRLTTAQDVAYAYVPVLVCIIDQLRNPEQYDREIDPIKDLEAVTRQLAATCLTTSAGPS